MHRVFLGSCLAACACGRVGFEARGDASNSATDVRAVAPCPVNPSVPDPITVSGQTFRYTSFDNMLALLPSVSVYAFDGDAQQTLIATTTSEVTAGAYTLSIPTGGVAKNMVLVYQVTNQLNTTVTLDASLDRHVAGASQPLWQLGDAPLWSASATSSVYTAFGDSRVATKGTVNVAVRTCAGAIIEGVQISIDVATTGIGYTGPDGVPAQGATQPPFAHAVLFNVEPGRATITASKDGMTFPSVGISVVADANNLTIIRAYE